MHLPAQLQNAIEQETLQLGLSKLTKAAADLSDRYRHQQQTTARFITTDAHRLAYAAVRMPATFAASRAALKEIHRLAPELQIESLLDLGAGTGAAAWAAAETFGQLQRLTLIEQDGRLIELGRKLARGSEHEALRVANWQTAKLRTQAEFAPHDLVICSYSLGEIEAAAVSRILNAAWRAARQALIVIEPGTMKGFETVRAARNQLLEAGASILAPCPHQNACPMPSGPAEGDADNWCHFAARFERSTLHRRLKGGTLGYEDEKFSYLAVSKLPIAQANARVIRHPLRHAGYTQLQLCTPEGLQTITITKRDKEVWKRARKTDWGDGWSDVSE